MRSFAPQPLPSPLPGAVRPAGLGWVNTTGSPNRCCREHRGASGLSTRPGGDAEHWEAAALGPRTVPSLRTCPDALRTLPAPSPGPKPADKGGFQGPHGAGLAWAASEMCEIRLSPGFFLKRNCSQRNIPLRRP